MWWYPLFGALFFVLVMRYLWKRRLMKAPTPPFQLAPDDPLMLEAIRKARESLSRMEELFAQRPRNTFVKVALQNDKGEPAHLWGQLLGFEENILRFKPVNQPLGEANLMGEEMARPISDLEDWQVELPDGRIRGGFTIIVMFERAKGQCRLPPEYEGQEQRYLDREELMNDN